MDTLRPRPAVIPPNVYCHFCGIILDHSPNELGTPSTTKRFWFEEVRAVISDSSSPGVVYLTGVGILETHNVLSAPLDDTRSYRDEGVLEDVLLSQKSDALWGYGFHNACWTLFRARLSHICRDVDIITSLFNQLFTTPCPNFSRFDFGHDYEGAASTHKVYGRPKPVDQYSCFYADPCEIPSVGELECSMPTIIDNLPSPVSCPPIGNSGVNRSFGRLSIELVYEIVSYLTFTQALTIRLVCRELALVVSPGRPPLSFWRTRFMLGHEQDFVFADTRVNRDWMRVFYGTRRLLRSKNGSLVNRKRIRNIMEPMAVVAELESRPPKDVFGIPISPVDSELRKCEPSRNEASDGLMSTVTAIKCFTGQTSSHPTPLETGCHVEQYRGQYLLSRCSESGGNITIFMVRLAYGDFIAGMSYTESQSSKHFPASQIGHCFSL